MRQQESLRIFKSDFMESLTHVHPSIPLIMWSPLALYLFYVSSVQKGLTVLEFLTWGLIAFIVWTFSEYSLHRFVFHFPAKNKVTKYLVFLFHGLHHDVPDDATRLVMPPVPAIILMTLLFGLFKMIIPSQYIELFMAFFIVGYLCYDYIHFATHHWPMKSKIGRFVKKWHLQHHYAHEESKFGVSNPLWDYVFGTVNAKVSRKEKRTWRP